MTQKHVFHLATLFIIKRFIFLKIISFFERTEEMSVMEK